jgi:NADP-dependent aldehyde dehydrogenase
VSAHLFQVPATVFADPSSTALREECFGPLAIVIRYLDRDDLSKALASADAALTFSVFTSPSDDDASWLIELGQTKAGRVIANGFPTGVGVSWSMQHGGPWPATTSVSATSVGASGIDRWLRPVTYQSVPEELLPEALQDDNPLGVTQRVDGVTR